MHGNSDFCSQPGEVIGPQVGEMKIDRDAAANISDEQWETMVTVMLSLDLRTVDNAEAFLEFASRICEYEGVTERVERLNAKIQEMGDLFGCHRSTVLA